MEDVTHVVYKDGSTRLVTDLYPKYGKNMTSKGKSRKAWGKVRHPHHSKLSLRRKPQRWLFIKMEKNGKRENRSDGPYGSAIFVIEPGVKRNEKADGLSEKSNWYPLRLL